MNARVTHRVALVLGTRPEAIKLAPLARSLSNEPDFDLTIISTGQHREMLKGTLDEFGLHVDIDLGLMRPGQELADLTATSISALNKAFAEEDPFDWVVVQGDTTSAMAAGLVAFYRRTRIAHVEAGLRSGVIDSPFPEEANRKILSTVTTLNFAPTETAAAALRAEGVPDERIVVTGNTVIDALYAIRSRPVSATAQTLLDKVADRRLILVTAHRREHWEGGLVAIFEAVVELAKRYEDVAFILPLHLNPIVQQAAAALRAPDLPPEVQARIIVSDPIGYVDFVPLMDAATLILTDSGGLQEEAPALSTPVLVLRDDTERPEAIEAGVARLIGPRRDAIISHTSELLSDSAAYSAMLQGGSPFGDGKASDRIVDALRSSNEHDAQAGT